MRLTLSLMLISSFACATGAPPPARHQNPGWSLHRVRPRSNPSAPLLRTRYPSGVSCEEEEAPVSEFPVDIERAPACVK